MPWLLLSYFPTAFTHPHGPVSLGISGCLIFPGTWRSSARIQTHWNFSCHRAYDTQPCVFSELLCDCTTKGSHFWWKSFINTIRYYQASLRPWVGYWLLGIMWMWYHTLDMWHDIVLVLNLKLILEPLAINVSFKAAPVSWLLTEARMARGLGLPRRFCNHSRASCMKSYQWLPWVGEKGPGKEGSAEGGEDWETRQGWGGIPISLPVSHATVRPACLVSVLLPSWSCEN